MGSVVKRQRSNEERRQFKRFRENFLVKFLDLRAGRVAIGRLYDIGAQGLSLILSDKLERAAYLRLWIDFPDKKGPLQTQGRVVWTEQLPSGVFRAGIDFEKPDFVGISRIFRV
ncbi:PilZ domain-containing protein [Candidatus Omnitrophota bacterium]